MEGLTWEEEALAIMLEEALDPGEEKRVSILLQLL